MIQKFLTSLLVLLIGSVHAQDTPQIYPAPKEIIALGAQGLSPDAYEALLAYGIPLSTMLTKEMDIVWNLDHSREGKSLFMQVKLQPELPAEGYRLMIRNDSISINAADPAGIFYAWQTLKQITTSQKGHLPGGFQVNDHPDFKRRGYMLDISRDKVPTMKSLYELVDLLAMLKYNELQLYTEHTFAYQNHREVWEDASPITPEEVQTLQQYCNARNIDLVPNQNSFGHMERWLEHDTYLPLAECPENCNTAWGLRKRHSLNPTHPGSIELMRSLYDELLPNFNSEYFNIGCDETIELGLGKSADSCKKYGKGRVYLNFVRQLYDIAESHGKKVQFWGDIILNHPELIGELPDDITALVWGYEADYPFEKHLPEFKNAGIDYYVCPGTSSWRSLTGRNHNSFLNLKNAATNGIRNDARGFLLTDWGDHGHWQPAVVSIPSIIAGASLSWNTVEDPEPGLAKWMDVHIFKDREGQFSNALLTLGNAYLASDIPAGNANIFHLMLHRYAWSLKGNYQTREMTKKGLIRSREELLKGRQLLEKAQPEVPEGTLMKDQLRLASALALHAIELGLKRLEAPDGEVKNIPRQEREILADTLGGLIEEHKRLWIQRNRTGGLEDSAQKLEDLRTYYLQD